MTYSVTDENGVEWFVSHWVFMTLRRVMSLHNANLIEKWKLN